MGFREKSENEAITVRPPRPPRPDTVAPPDPGYPSNLKLALAPPRVPTELPLVRQTLRFPASEVVKRVPPRPARASKETIPPPVLVEESTPNERVPAALLEPDRSHAAEPTPRRSTSLLVTPLARPSDISTTPTGDAPLVSDSSAKMVELSASDLESEPSAHGPPRAAAREETDTPIGYATLEVPPPLGASMASNMPYAGATTDRPPSLPPTALRRRTVAALVLSHVAVAAVALVVGARKPAAIAIDREPNVAVAEVTPLGAPPAAAPPAVPSGGCTTSGGSRVLASRAQIGPGLDVSVLDNGFGVALAGGAMEAVGLRVDGSGLRVAESVRVKTSSLVTHAVVNPGHDEESDGLGVRIDLDDARTVMGAGDGPPFRVVARGASMMALVDSPHGVRVRNLWPLPPPAPQRHGRAPAVVRATARDDGGAVIALRRPSVYWLGVVDSALTPTGPLVPLVRKGATIGTPAVAPWGSGGVVAWSERLAGEHEWTIYVASFTSEVEVGPAKAIGKGISPTLAALPDGELLLAYADGPAGAHRIVARRLGRDLDLRGEPLVLSPESVNTGQPVAAVRPDGRALVAFFAADSALGAPRTRGDGTAAPRTRGNGTAAPRTHGEGTGAVVGTPLACDPGY